MIETIVILFLLCLFLVSFLANMYKELKQTKEELQAEKCKVADLCLYIEEKNKIYKEKELITEKLADADSEDEISSIVADIIAINNSRVRNNETSSTTAETRKKRD